MCILPANTLTWCTLEAYKEHFTQVRRRPDRSSRTERTRPQNRLQTRPQNRLQARRVDLLIAHITRRSFGLVFLWFCSWLLSKISTNRNTLCSSPPPPSPFTAQHDDYSLFILFGQPIKSLLFGTKYVFKHQYLWMYFVNVIVTQQAYQENCWTRVPLKIQMYSTWISSCELLVLIYTWISSEGFFSRVILVAFLTWIIGVAF